MQQRCLHTRRPLLRGFQGSKRITDLLAITKLLTVFETFDVESDAIKSFSSSAKV